MSSWLLDDLNQIFTIMSYQPLEDGYENPERAGWVWWCIMLFGSIMNIFFLYELHSNVKMKTKAKVCNIIFNIVCVIRATLPRLYWARGCFHDIGFISSPLFGRAIAFAAEVSYSAQLADHFRINSFHTLASSLFFLGTLANCFCTYGTLVGNTFYYCCEMSCWSIMGIIMVICSYRSYLNTYKLSDLLTIFCCIVFISCSSFPMVQTYWRWFQIDEANKKTYFSFLEGILDTSYCHFESKSIYKMKHCIEYQLPYFTCAVWSSNYFARQQTMDKKKAV